MALWLIVTLTVMAGLFGLTLSINPAIRNAATGEANPKLIWAGCAGALVALALTVGWVWHAAETGDWRYAVMGLSPFACSVIRAVVLREWRSPSAVGAQDGAER